MNTQATEVHQAQAPEYSILLEDANRTRSRDTRIKVRLTVAPDHYPFAGHLWPMGTSDGVITVKDLSRAQKLLEPNTFGEGESKVSNVSATAAAKFEQAVLQHARDKYGYDKAGSQSERDRALSDARATVGTSIPVEFEKICGRYPLPILKIEEIEKDIPSVLDEEDVRRNASAAAVLRAEVLRQQGGQQNQKR